MPGYTLLFDSPLDGQTTGNPLPPSNVRNTTRASLGVVSGSIQFTDPYTVVGSGVTGYPIAPEALGLTSIQFLLFQPFRGLSLQYVPGSVTAATNTGSVGVAGGFTFTVSTIAKLTVGMTVSGTGIGTNAKVTAISGTTVTVNVANTGAVSGTLTFTAPGKIAVYNGSVTDALGVEIGSTATTLSAGSSTVTFLAFGITNS